MSGNFKAKDNPRTFKSSTNTNFIVRRTEGTREGIETEWNPENRNVSFPWNQRLFVVVNSRESHKIWPRDKIRSQITEGIVRSIWRRLPVPEEKYFKKSQSDHWTLEYPVHSV